MQIIENLQPQGGVAFRVRTFISLLYIQLFSYFVNENIFLDFNSL